VAPCSAAFRRGSRVPTPPRGAATIAHARGTLPVTPPLSAECAPVDARAQAGCISSYVSCLA